MISSRDYVGVDVSKTHLDLALAGPRVQRLPNTPAGMSRLVQQLARLSRPHVVCEATGSYTRLLARELGGQPGQPAPGARSGPGRRDAGQDRCD